MISHPAIGVFLQIKMELHPLFLLHRLSLPAHFRRFVAKFHQFTISNDESWVSIVEFCLMFLAYISREILDLAIFGLKSYFLSVENWLSLSLGMLIFCPKICHRAPLFPIYLTRSYASLFKICKFNSSITRSKLTTNRSFCPHELNDSKFHF